MALLLPEIARSFRRNTRRVLIVVGIGLLIFALVGFVALPMLIKAQAEKLAFRELQRELTIGKVAVNPFALTIDVHDLKLMERDGKDVFATFEHMRIDLSSQSIRELAPIVKTLQLTKPYLHVVRETEGGTNVDDISKMISSRPASDGPAHFAITNISVENGRILFDDKPAGVKHDISDLALGVPFLSSFPTDVEIFVEPSLRAIIDGTPLQMNGKLRPFTRPADAYLQIDLDRLDLSRYLAYLPLQPGFKIPSARLTTKLTASFQRPAGKPRLLLLNGNAFLHALQVVGPNGKQLLNVPELRIDLNNTNALGDRIDIARIALDKLQVNAMHDRNGRLDLASIVSATTPPAVVDSEMKPARSSQRVSLQVAVDELAISDATVHYRDEQPRQHFAAGAEKLDMTVRKLLVDPRLTTIRIEEIASTEAILAIRYGKEESTAAKTADAADRQVDATVTPTQETANRPAVPPQVSPATTQAANRLSIKRLAIQNWNVRVEDRTTGETTATVIHPLSMSVQNLSNAPDSRSRMELKATVNGNGKLALDGDIGIGPLQADLATELKNIDLLPLQPYFTEDVNIRFTGADLSAKGRLQLRTPATGPLDTFFKGDIELENVAATDKVSGDEFLRWKSLSFNGADLRVAPFALNVGQIALNDFFARVIIDTAGRVNVQNIVRDAPEERKSVTDARDQGASGAGSENRETAAGSKDKGGKMPPITIGKLVLADGRIRFTDNFIKPSYTTNLMNFGGVVSGLSSARSSTANVDLKGLVNRAPLTVVGAVNPLRGDLLLDINAKVRGMDMPALSPYSEKFLGYGIRKGKLSFEVAYKVKNRELTAQNQLKLDQLTLGDKVDSPSATTLPVRFALSLLRDRNGVIDVNVPVSGSLDDPQFSVGGVILKLIGNVIAKAVSQPFAMLGSAFGNDGKELSALEFEPGRATISAEGEATLKTLAKALLERPALQLEITARTDPVADTEGLKEAIVGRKVRMLKARETGRKGETVTPEDVVVTDAEYPSLLAKVYKEEKFDKPRNFIGIPKTLPAGEMERMIIANTPVEQADLAALANRRALAVKEWLMKSGQVPGGKLHLVDAKPASTGQAQEDAEAASTRVDFALR